MLNISKPAALLNLLLLLFMLSGCGGDNCYDADDFGFAKFNLSSRYKEQDIISFQPGNEVGPWIDSGYRVNGRPLTIMVKTWEYGIELNNPGELSAWCPWHGTDENFATLSNICARLRPCEFKDGKMCTPGRDAQIKNPPCLYKNGLGAYALLAHVDPNQSFITQFSPEGVNMHLGEPHNDFKLFDVGSDGSFREAGGIVYKYKDDENLKRKYAGSKLYLKIVDKFYGDNAGQYRLFIKSGVSDKGTDPIEYITKLVKENLFGTEKDYGIIRRVYLNIINNPGYRMAVSAVLSLYIVFTVLSFLSGNIQLTHTELITRIIKIAIVSALLSTKYAWSFFNDYLFVYFVGGVEQVINIIQEAASSGPGSTSLLGLMIAPPTMAKLFSVLFVDWLGFIYIILFLIALFFIVMISLNAAVIYLTALIAIGMIIVMAPIFICFMLFDITRSLFENWLKHLISYALQPLILFTGIAFISFLIRAEIYSTLGFRVCKYDFPDLGVMSKLLKGASVINPMLKHSIFYWWFPSPMKGENFSRQQAVIPVPVDHRLPDGTLCDAYACNEKRYIELPFLDPVKDKKRLKAFFSGKFVHLDGLFLIFIAIYLLHKFNSVAISVAKFLTGTTGSLTNMEASGMQSFKGLWNPAAGFVAKPFNKVAEKGREGISSLTIKAEQAFDNRMLKGLSDEAADPSKANKAVLAEVKRTYGLDQSAVKNNADELYKQALTTRLNELNNGREEKLSSKEIDDKAKELSSKSYKELQYEFAKVIGGKEANYNSLSDESKDAVDKALGLKELSVTERLALKGLANDAQDLRDFKEAYVEAHQNMSGRGIGVLGKKISLLRSFEEMQHDVDQYKAAKESKRRNLGEKLYGVYGNVAHGEVWHEYNYNDPRLRTHNETLKDQAEELKRDKLKQELNRETLRAKDDVLKPEYMVKLAKEGQTDQLNYYRDLGSRKLKSDIQSKLTAGENPVLMGDKFMREKATDSQMKEMIDRAENIRSNMLQEDRYLRRESYYEVGLEKSADVLHSKHKQLGEHFKFDQINTEEMEGLLKQYHKEKGTDPALAQQDVEYLRAAAKEYTYNKQVLDEIKQRKLEINEEIDRNIENINKYRKAAKMQEYKPSQNKP